MVEKQVQHEMVIQCEDRKTKNWYAWFNKMPPKPGDLHVIGEMEVPNSGVYAVLTKRQPQGINPQILLLDLLLIQKPGIWPQVTTSVQARYDEVAVGGDYKEVNVLCSGDVITRISIGLAKSHNEGEIEMMQEKDVLGWNQENWDMINKAVYDECQRTKVGKKFLPLYGPMPGARTVQTDTTAFVENALCIEEGAETPLIEIFVEFELTKQQLEDTMSTNTLATRATNLLSQAEDLLLFQGDAVTNEEPLFTENRVGFRSGPLGEGLLLRASLPEDGDSNQVIVVPPRNSDPTDSDSNRYGENTFKQVALAYSRLQALGHYGPYALVLHTDIYADTYAPLQNTLIMPADRIKPLMTTGFFGTGTVPERTGVLVSLGGTTMDLVSGVDAMAEFVQINTKGLYRFRVYERFALRIKDKSAIIRLEFLQPTD